MRTAFQALRAASPVPCGCYANTGHPGPLGEDAIRRDVDTEGFVDASRAWIEEGARIIGGCCGTTPEHIEALVRQYVPETLASAKAEIAAWFEERYRQQPSTPPPSATRNNFV